jgi:16S rRNA (uracil1498-N3)-methyltransferase
MQQTRLHVAGTYTTGSRLRLDADRAHYLGRVLRLKTGARLLVFDGDGNEFAATLDDLEKRSATLRVDEKTQPSTETKLCVHLVQGMSRGERMDFVVQKATELGVKRITPVLTERGVVKLDRDRATRRRDHWQKVASSACEQSGRVRLPLIDTPLRLTTWLRNMPQTVDAQLILQPGAVTPLAETAPPATKVCLLIGPEGGFSASEVEDATRAGFRAVGLGPRVLRTETCAIAALAVMQSLWGDLC